MTTLGCLTGNGRGIPIDGTYAYHRRGLKEALPPDLAEEDAPISRPIPFASGSLCDGNDETSVGWKGRTVGESGVDIVIDLKDLCFVDRVVLRRPEGDTPPGQMPENRDYAEPSGLSCVAVYARAETDAGFVLSGRAGEPGPAALPDDAHAVSVATGARELIVRLISFQRDILLSELEIWGASIDEPRVFPVPRQMELRSGEEAFALAEGTKVVIGHAASDDTRFAAGLFAEKVAERFGISLDTVECGEGEMPVGAILLGRPGETATLDREQGSRDLKPEGYALTVGGSGVRLLAPDRRGLIYGAETLLQLLQPTDGGASAEACTIDDHPRMEFRGVHIYLPARDEIPYAKRLIRYLLAPMKMNTVFLELAGGMQFERRPEINQAWEEANRKAAEENGRGVPHGSVCGGGWITKEEIKDFLDYARSYGLEVIPEIQSLSHVQYLTITYPEIAEDPDSEYPDTYCPLNPESHKIVFDMIDEVVDLFQPLRYIHMGHDEVYTMAVCERCKGKSRAELYAHDVNKIYDYLKGKGLGMMVWADMLQDWRYYAGPDTVPLIPKDIVMLEFVWYFRTEHDTEDVLLDNGFKVIIGNYYSSHFTRFATRSKKENVIGAQVSVWGRTNEETMGIRGKLYDFVYSANTTWSDHYHDELRWTLDRRISEIMPRLRSQLHDVPYPSAAVGATCVPLDISGSCTAPLRDLTGEKGGYDVSGVPQGQVALKGIPFQIGEGVIIAEAPGTRNTRCPSEIQAQADTRADSLVFLHTCSTMGPVREPVARYEVRYTDGSAEGIDVAYGHHVAEWNRRHGAPLANTAYRHFGYIATYPADPLWQGKTPQGGDVTLYGLEWINPHPDKVIGAVRIEALKSGGDCSPIVVAITAVTSAGNG